MSDDEELVDNIAQKLQSKFDEAYEYLQTSLKWIMEKNPQWGTRTVPNRRKTRPVKIDEYGRKTDPMPYDQYDYVHSDDPVCIDFLSSIGLEPTLLQKCVLTFEHGEILQVETKEIVAYDRPL